MIHGLLRPEETSMITDLTQCRIQTKALQPEQPVLHPGDRNTQIFLGTSVLTHSALSALCAQVLVLISVGINAIS